MLYFFKLKKICLLRYNELTAMFKKITVFTCVNGSPARYGFSAYSKAIHYSANIA